MACKYAFINSSSKRDLLEFCANILKKHIRFVTTIIFPSCRLFVDKLVQHKRLSWPLAQTTMFTESHWRVLKYNYKYNYNQPCLDQLRDWNRFNRISNFFNRRPT